MDIPDSLFETPAAAGRRAQLLLALLLLSVLPVFLLTFPIETHSVKVNLPRLPETFVPPNPSGPDAYVMTTMVVRHTNMDLEPPRGVHELVVTPQDQILFNGRQVDVLGLRTRLDVVEVRNEWVDLQPDPNARYEMFAEVLAIAKRARLERLRLDSRPFRKSIDESASSWMPPSQDVIRPRP